MRRAMICFVLLVTTFSTHAAHESVCSTVKLLPQSHLEGSLDGVQPYRRDQGIMKSGLVQGKAVIGKRKNSEPCGGTLLLGKVHCPLQ